MNNFVHCIMIFLLGYNFIHLFINTFIYINKVKY